MKMRKKKEKYSERQIFFKLPIRKFKVMFGYGLLVLFFFFLERNSAPAPKWEWGRWRGRENPKWALCPVQSSTS